MFLSCLNTSFLFHLHLGPLIQANWSRAYNQFVMHAKFASMPSYPYLGRPETGLLGIELRAAALCIERAYSDSFLGRLIDTSGRNRIRKPQP